MTTRPPTTRTATAAVRPPTLLMVLLTALLTVAMLGLAPSSAPPAEAAAGDPDKLADFEAGEPGGWFTYNGASSVAASFVTVGDTDAAARPGQVGDNGVVEVAFDITDFGGFGQDIVSLTGGPADWSNREGLSFWFHGTGSGLVYQAEISDNRSDPGLDTSERFDVEFTDDVAGWRRIDLPWSVFTRATDFQPAGAPDDGLTLTEVYAYAIVLPFGSDTVMFDDIDADDRVVIDFEDGLPPSGTDAVSGTPLGFFNFQGAGSTISTSVEATPPAPLSFDAGPDNQALAVTMDVGSFAGFIQTFADETATTWTPQDWSAYEGFAFWFHGQGTGTDMFIDLLENRNEGSTSDDAERLTYPFVDDSVGWRYIQVPFAAITHKEIGNGAPNDGFTGEEMHGWALGALNTDGPVTWHVDGVSLYGSAGSIPLTVSFAQNAFEVTEGGTGEVTVKLNRAMLETDPAEVTVAYRTEPATAVADEDYTPVSGSLTFVPEGPREQTFAIETFGDEKFQGTLRTVLRLFDADGAEISPIRQGSLLILDDDTFDPLLLDDFERAPYLWDADEGVVLEQASDDADGEGGPEGVLSATVESTGVDVSVEGRVCNRGKGVTTVIVHGSETLDVSAIDHTALAVNGLTETHVDDRTGEPVRHEEDADGDGFMDLVLHVRVPDDHPLCDGAPVEVTGVTDVALGRAFPGPQDWRDNQSLSFWFNGTGEGDHVTVEVLDDEAPDPGPDEWELVWSDEFDAPAGSPPDPANWWQEIGDVTPDGKNGWGNEERQYYTDDPENAAHDGEGNLEIVLREADGEQECYYGTCEYTSARLLSWHRAEFQYGRIESRMKVPVGGGLWPAFWSLGTDIDRNPWPGAGEIDFMEYVGRLPDEIFGTIHGPGYNGGASFGNVYTFDEPVANEFHTYTVEWQPERIDWYVDGILYHSATPEDVAPNPWVFEKPFFLLLNMAIGGNFGGTIDPDIELPATFEVDYVRVSQAPDTAERFEASFVDDVEGWRRVTVPFSDFVRSAEQPAGAPDNGFGLREVNGYGFRLPDSYLGDEVRVEEVRLDPTPPPTEVIVTTTADSGDGSLRAQLARVAEGGTVTFDPAIAGGTVGLSSGPITITKDVTIDAADAPGLTLDGQGTDRVLIVEAGATATVRHLTLANGYGFQLAGGVLNNGDLTLDHVVVTGNTMTTDAGDFWQGGGGIYNGENSSLYLVDSTVSGNSSGWTGGGIYSFFGSTTTIERSTIVDNVSADVAGGIRALGDMDVTNSTISGNTSTTWHGGAVFLTDGVTSIVNSTIAANTSPPGTGDVFVGTFTDASASLELTNTIVASDTVGCFLAPFGAGAVSLTSGGHNVVTDDSCGAPAAGDQFSTDPLIGPLADNGGPTMTHALLAGSPAIDAADPDACPAVDQRGEARDAACDVGSFEYLP